MEITKKFEVSAQDMEYLLVAAFEGGINYWCGQVEITKYPEDMEEEEQLYASDIIGRGGELKLYDVEEPEETWVLTQEKMLNGISKAMEWGDYGTVEELMDAHDADTADVIVQYALFDEIVFG